MRSSRKEWQGHTRSRPGLERTSREGDWGIRTKAPNSRRKGEVGAGIRNGQARDVVPMEIVAQMEPRLGPLWVTDGSR